MAQLYNSLFVKDPKQFVDSYTVDIKTWFESIMRQSIKDKKVFQSRCLLEAADQTGFCRADMDPVGGYLGFGITTVQLRFVPIGGINAYWVPYHAGTGLPGFTDVLRSNPDCNFVFTAGMNGCAFIVTDSPKGVQYMRVYHNQHPDDDGISQDIVNASGATISSLRFDEYGGGELKEMRNPLAFNFLHFHDGEWHYVFQPQSFNALSLAPAKRLVGQSGTRPVF